MTTTGDIIEGKVRDFARDICLALERARQAAVRSGAAEARLVRVRFEPSRNRASLQRTPEQQAALVARGRSWTCAGAHMLDSARHVLLKVTPPGGREATSFRVSEAFGRGEQHFMTMDAFQSEWASVMRRNGLLNYAGRAGYGASDPFHLELPDSRVPLSDPRVQSCLREYARLMRAPSARANEKFESSRLWGPAVRPFLSSSP